ncbi:MAG: dephospho-CoA kinase [Alteromonadaceae bacterium]|mgnify:FL=1|jgi:dephospho-CoA kinase|tara:strand:- start:1217 stop:1825 length:609 start_codon:yes stop_codon:yes gene_type:complete
MAKFIVGLTGGISSGKTTIANMFADLGIDIIDADLIAREVVQPDSKALVAIAQHFGNDYITQNGELNRTLLRTTIFRHNDEKLWLTNLLHPLIRQNILSALAASHSAYCLLVAPLLLENRLDKLVNTVLVIDTSEALQVSRTLSRDKSSKEEVQAIINSQISRAERIAAADYIIDNSNTDLLSVRQQVINLDGYFRDSQLEP